MNKYCKEVNPISKINKVLEKQIMRANNYYLKNVDLSKINNITRTIIRNICWNFDKITENNSKPIYYSINKAANLYVNTNTPKYIKNFIKLTTDVTSDIIPYKFEYTNNFNKSIIDFNFVDSRFMKQYFNFNNIYGIAFPPGTNQWENINNKQLKSNGNLFINKDWFNETHYIKGSYLFLIVLHEFGHALGLSHPHDVGGNSTIINGINSPYSSGTLGQNDFIYTVMTYNDIVSKYGTKKISRSGYTKTWMSYDIAALQYLYGLKKNIGDDTYYIDSYTWSCFHDNLGNNTLSAEKANSGTIINLNNSNLDNNSKYAGGYISTSNSKSGAIIANGSNINNAIGSNFNDTIYSNNNSEKINSGAGNDNIIVNNMNINKKLIVNGNDGFDILQINDNLKNFTNIIATKNVDLLIQKNDKIIIASNIQKIKLLDTDIDTIKYLNQSRINNKDVYIYDKINGLNVKNYNIDLFDWKFYVTYYKDLSIFTTRNQALSHWNNFGKYENRIINKNQLNKETENKQSNNDYFDWEFYLTYYKDLSIFTTKNQALKHWNEFGKFENRIINKNQLNKKQTDNDIFDWVFYVTYYKDLFIFTTKNQALKHWNNYGKYENRITNKNQINNKQINNNYFDWEFYVTYYKDLSIFTTKNQAFNHYNKFGKYEKRLINKSQIK